MTHIAHLSLPTPPDFDLASTLSSHGWVVLSPNVYNKEINSFSRVEALPGGRVARLTVSSSTRSSQNKVNIAVESPSEILSSDKKYIKEQARHILRLDEEYSEFHDLCREKGGVWAGLACGKGRMLRSPSLFEDLVKVICTTNIQWGGTRRMLAELVNAFGTHVSPQQGERTFPDAHTLAALDEALFSSRVRLGYRGKFVLGLAKDLAEGRLDAGRWLDPHMPTGEIKKQLLAIKGIGSYAAASMLMLLGRYEDIPVDTVFREFMAEKYFQGKEFDLESALSIYAKWGKWKYLAYWFEMIDA